MTLRFPLLSSISLACCLLAARDGTAQGTREASFGRPEAIVDLATRDGVALVKGTWRYSDASIIEVDHRSPGPELKASGAPNRTHDIRPRAGRRDFDDSGRETIEPSRLVDRRSTGRLCFNWYRIHVTIPERVGKLDPTGATAVFEIVVDDYAEVWVDGKLPLVQGQAGGSLVKGWNAPNRVLLGRGVKPGQQFQLAVLGMNGPISDPPANFIWIRSATLDFYREDPAGLGKKAEMKVVRLDPSLDGIVPPGASLEKLADGFQFIEGPVWNPDGFLLFSDPNDNKIIRWASDGEVSIYRTKSGYAGLDIGEYHQPGSNGLAFDREGRLTVCEHGNRRVTRIEKNGDVTVLAARFEGKRLNSPNDLVYRSDGSLYFTDPPFGLPQTFDDERRELPFSGVYRWKDGELACVSRDLEGPNGLAFSPDERFLYVDNWDVRRKVVMRYEVGADGSLSSGKVFFDATSTPGDQALDGLKVDRESHLYVSGPGGIWILSAEGKHLGAIQPPEPPANFAWGGEDGKALFMTARTGLYRARLGVAGAGASNRLP